MNEFETRLRRFINEYAESRSLQLDKGDSIGSGDLSALSQYDLLTPCLGGYEPGSVYRLVELTRQLSCICGNLKNIPLVTLGMVGSILFFLDGEEFPWAKEKLEQLRRGESLGALAVTEQSGGSDYKNFRTEVSRLSSDGLILRGAKKWVTFAANSDFYIVQAKLDDEHRFVYVPRDLDGVSSFAVEEPLGNRGSGFGDLVFEDVAIREDWILPKEISIGQGKEDANISLPTAVFRFGRFLASYSAAGLTAECLNSALKRLMRTKSFGKPLIEQSAWRARIISVYKKLVLVDAGLSGIRNNLIEHLLDLNDHFSLIKVYGSEMVVEAAELNAHANGAESYCMHSKSNRFCREAFAYQFIEGGTEMLSQKIFYDCVSRSLVGSL